VVILIAMGGPQAHVAIGCKTCSRLRSQEIK